MDAPESAINTALHRVHIGVWLEHNRLDVRILPWNDIGFDHIYGPQLVWRRPVQEFLDDTWGEAVLRADTAFSFGRMRSRAVS